MAELRHLFLWGLAVTGVTLAALGLGLYLMYSAGYQRQGEVLQDLVETQAAMIGAVARFDREHSHDFSGTVAELDDSARAATLSQVRDAFHQSRGLGKTGEFVLGTRRGDQILILLHQREHAHHGPHRIALDAGIGEPIRRALAGERGVIEGIDIHGERVLAALHPLPELDWALVAKKDLREVREPYLMIAGVAGMVAVALVMIAGLLFRQASKPLLHYMQSSRDRYNKLIQTAAQGIILVDSDDRISLANRKAKEIFDLGDDVEGRHLLEAMPAAMADTLKQKLSLRHQGREDHYEVSLEINGGLRHLGISATPFMSAEGRYEGTLAVISDVTERRETRESLERERKLLRAVLNTLPVGVWAVDRNGHFFLHNPAGDELLGVADYGGGRALFLEFKGWDASTGRQLSAEDWGMLRALDRGESILGQVIEFQRGDGEERTLRYSAVPLWGEGGERLGAITVAEDITEERRTSQLLHRVLENLPVGVWVVDAEGQFILHNPAGEEIWQGARYQGGQQVYGEYRGWWADTGEPIAPEEWAVARAVNHGETSLNELVDIQCFDGSRKTILNSAVPMRDDRGRISGAIIVNEDITHRRAMEKLIQRNEQLLERVLHNLPVGVALTDDQGRFMMTNGCDREIWGQSRLGRMASDFPGEARPEGQRQLLSRGDWPVERVLASGCTIEQEVLELTLADGQSRVLSCSAAPVLGGDGSLWGAVEFVQDITDARRDQAEMRKLSDAVRQTADAITLMDANGQIEYANDAFLEMTGFSEKEVIGHRPTDLLQTELPPDTDMAEVFGRLTRGEAYHGVTVNRGKSGRPMTWDATVTPMLDSRGHMTGLVGTATNISGHEEIREELYRATRFDMLTGLGLRGHILDQLSLELAGAGYRPHVTGLVLMDIHQFSAINESMGHEGGDQVLREFARRIGDLVREGDVVARIGADSFAVMLADVAREEDVAPVVSKLRGVADEPLLIDGRPLYFNMNFGVALAPKDGTTAQSLFRHAESALAEARDCGANALVFYDADLGSGYRRRLELEIALRESVDKAGFQLHFQPQINLVSGMLRGMEALIRWRHPQLGDVSPAEFIPVAERAGLIGEISVWVMHEALRQRGHWQAMGLQPGRVSVNISAPEFAGAELVDRVREALAATGQGGDALELELTETAFVGSTAEVRETLEQLKDLGVSVSVDDFGTGYSSLAYLSALPIDVLKIDRAFVTDLEMERCRDASIINAVLSLGHSLGAEVIAEGVETRWQLDFLAQAGCDAAQGFYLSRPVPGEQVAELLRREDWLKE